MPRAGLTPERVTAEAADLVDKTGWEKLTLAALAERCGVALPSLYKHVPGLEALKREIALVGLRELGEVLARATVGRARSEALESMCSAYRKYAVEHPGGYAATQRAPSRSDAGWVEASDRVLQIVLAVLRGYGLSGQDAIDATRAVRASLHGFALLETTQGFGHPRDVNRSFERMVAGMDRMLAAWPAAAGPTKVSGRRSRSGT